jgi:hypothetical protein
MVGKISSIRQQDVIASTVSRFYQRNCRRLEKGLAGSPSKSAQPVVSAVSAIFD